MINEKVAGMDVSSFISENDLGGENKDKQFFEKFPHRKSSLQPSAILK
jgi:hypothetical protein